jgi:hypothetical protein
MTQCGQFKDVAFRRHGILSCLDQLTVQFNQGQVTTMTNIHRAFEMTPEYYNGVALINTSQLLSLIVLLIIMNMQAGANIIETLNEDGDKFNFYPSNF